MRSSRDSSVALVFLLALVRYVQSHPGKTREQLAEHFDVDVERIDRAVEVLGDSGHKNLEADQVYGIDWEGFLEYGQLMVTQVLVEGPPRLTADEMQTILVGFRLMGSSIAESGIDTADLVSRLIAIGTAPGRSMLDDTFQVVDPQVTDPVWVTLREAGLTDKQVRIEYISAAEERSVRDIDPLELYRRGPNWIVRSWCHSTQAVRHFRLDRIASATALPTVQAHPARMKEKTSVKECTVDLSAEALWLVEDLPAIAVEPAASGAQATFRVLDEDWMVSQLLSMAPYVVSVEPEGFRAAAAKRAREGLDVWQQFLA